MSKSSVGHLITFILHVLMMMVLLLYRYCVLRYASVLLRSGNDITSSCLYVVGLCTTAAGVWAPVALVMIAFMLYLFRSVYGEVGSALPLNGGAYNALLNTTTKATASV